MPQDVRLLKSHRNVIFGLVRDSGLDPTAFDWGEEEVFDDEDDTFSVSVLKHAPTGFYFRFGLRWDKYSPGFGSPTDSRIVTRDWDDRFRLVHEWLSYVKREYEAPDLWVLQRLREVTQVTAFQK
jgi:flavin-dependent dehydrogenase